MAEPRNRWAPLFQPPTAPPSRPTPPKTRTWHAVPGTPAGPPDEPLPERYDPVAPDGNPPVEVGQVYADTRSRETRRVRIEKVNLPNVTAVVIAGRGADRAVKVRFRTNPGAVALDERWALEPL